MASEDINYSGVDMMNIWEWGRSEVRLNFSRQELMTSE